MYIARLQLPCVLCINLHVFIIQVFIVFKCNNSILPLFACIATLLQSVFSSNNIVIVTVEKLHAVTTIFF